MVQRNTIILQILEGVIQTDAVPNKPLLRVPPIVKAKKLLNLEVTEFPGLVPFAGNLLNRGARQIVTDCGTQPFHQSVRNFKG